MEPQSVEESYDKIKNTWEAYVTRTWCGRRELPSPDSFRLVVVGHIIATPPLQQGPNTPLADGIFNEAVHVTGTFMAVFGAHIWDLMDPTVQPHIQASVLDYIWNLLQAPIVVVEHDLYARRRAMQVVLNRRQGRRGSLSDPVAPFEQTAEGALLTDLISRGRSASATATCRRRHDLSNGPDELNDLERQLRRLRMTETPAMQQRSQEQRSQAESPNTTPDAIIDGESHAVRDEDSIGENIRAYYAAEMARANTHRNPGHVSDCEFHSDLPPPQFDEEEDRDEKDGDDEIQLAGSERSSLLHHSPPPVRSQHVCDVPTGIDHANGESVYCGEGFVDR